MFDGFVKKNQLHRMYPFCNGSDKAPLVKYWFDIVRHKRAVHISTKFAWL